MRDRVIAPAAALAILAVLLMASASAQIQIDWPASLETSLSPDAWNSLPKRDIDAVAIRYTGNSGSYASPVTGTLFSLATFLERARNNMTPSNAVVLLASNPNPIMEPLRDIQKQGAIAAICRVQLEGEIPGKARFFTDGSGVTDIKIPVFQIGGLNYDRINNLFVGANGSLFDGQGNITIVGRQNPFEISYLSTGSYIVQVLVLLIGALALVVQAVGLVEKWRKAKRFNLAVTCLILLILGVLSKMALYIDPSARSDIFPAFIRIWIAFLFYPFSGTAMFIIMAFWSSQMARKGIQKPSRVCLRTSYVLGPFFAFLLILLLAVNIIFRNDLWNLIPGVVFIVCATVITISYFIFLLYIIYGSIITRKYIASQKKITGTVDQIRRVVFTQKLLVASVIFLIINASFFFYVGITEEPVFSVYAVAIGITTSIVVDVLFAMILVGRVNVFKKPADGTKTDTDKTSTSAGMEKTARKGDGTTTTTLSAEEVQTTDANTSDHSGIESKS